MRLSLFLFALAVFGSSALRAGTTLIYENYNDANPYVNGSGLNVVQGDAIPFTVGVAPPDGSAFALSDIEFVGAVRNTESLNTVTANLYDTINGRPGDVLESFSLTLDPATLGAPVFQLKSEENPILVTGQEYWFGLSDPASNDLTWFFEGLTEANVATLNNGVWSYNPGQYTEGAFQVNAELVTSSPEPTTLLMLGGGLALLLGRKLWS